MTEANKSGFLKSLKGLVFEEVQVNTPAPVGQQGKVFAQSVPAPTPVVPPASSIDPEIAKALEKAILAAAKPAYSEFAALSDSMEPAIPDEQMRFKAVLMALSAKGLTLKQILIDIDECQEALDKKAKEGADASAAARASRVGTKEQEAQAMLKEIDELNKKVIGLQLKHEGLCEQISTESADIFATEQRYSTTVNAMRQQLASRKTKLSAYSSTQG